MSEEVDQAGYAAALEVPEIVRNRVTTRRRRVAGLAKCSHQLWIKSKQEMVKGGGAHRI